jgi:DNA-binding transcriptional MerR regulator
MPADPSEAGLLRMRHLVERTGLPRETIHFYISAGLVPPPRKSKRNAALYGEEHVARLKLVRELRDRSFLPLKAIRDLLEGGADAGLRPEQRALMAEVRARLGGAETGDLDRVRLDAVLRRTGVGRTEASEFRKLGMIEIEGRGERATLSREDAALLDVWGRLKTAGVFTERGVSPRHAVVVRDAVDRLATDEMTLFTGLYSGLPPARAAEVVASVVPLLNEMIGVFHGKRIRRFFEEEAARPARGRAAAPRRRRGR